MFKLSDLKVSVIRFAGVFVLALILGERAQAQFQSQLAYPWSNQSSPYYQPYQTNLNYYGTPWGQVPPMYFYPGLTPYPGIAPINYFMPHYPSPYGPGNYCPTCNPYTPPPIVPQQNQSHWPIMS